MSASFGTEKQPETSGSKAGYRRGGWRTENERQRKSGDVIQPQQTSAQCNTPNSAHQGGLLAGTRTRVIARWQELRLSLNVRIVYRRKSELQAAEIRFFHRQTNAGAQYQPEVPETLKCALVASL
jgi:hypothetical protein